MHWVELLEPLLVVVVEVVEELVHIMVAKAINLVVEADILYQIMEQMEGMVVYGVVEEEEWLADKPMLRMAYSRELERTDPRRGPFLQRLSLELARRAGIRLELVPADNYEESLAMLRRGEADLVSNVPPSADFARRFGIFVGQPFYNAPISLAVANNARPGSGLRIATTPEFLSVQETYLQTYPSDRFVLYSTPEECCEAVSRGPWPTASGRMSRPTPYPSSTRTSWPSPAGRWRRWSWIMCRRPYGRCS